MSEFFFLFQIIFLGFTALLLLVKTVHYFISIRRKNLINWFYFNLYSIVNSQTEESERAKKVQNRFTLTIVALVLLIVLSVLISRFLQQYLPWVFS